MSLQTSRGGRLQENISNVYHMEIARYANDVCAMNLQTLQVSHSAFTQNIQLPLTRWNRSVNTVTWLKALRPRNQEFESQKGHRLVCQPQLPGQHWEATGRLCNVFHDSFPRSKMAGTGSCHTSTHCRFSETAKLHLTCGICIHSRNA
jgi:hypothetical protein